MANVLVLIPEKNTKKGQLFAKNLQNKVKHRVGVISEREKKDESQWSKKQ